MPEIWKDVKGYEGIYQVSDLGRVKSLERKVLHKNRWGLMHKTVPERILKPGYNKAGYESVILCIDGVKQSIRVNRLVAETFLPNPENKEQVNHKNGVRNDNRVDNLEWVTSSENQLHSFRVLGRKPTGLGTTMSDELRAKLKPYWEKAKTRGCRKVQCIDTGVVYFSIAEASRRTGAIKSNISRCLAGIRPTAGKLRWRYVNG